MSIDYDSSAGQTIVKVERGELPLATIKAGGPTPQLLDWIRKISKKNKWTYVVCLQICVNAVEGVSEQFSSGMDQFYIMYPGDKLVSNVGIQWPFIKHSLNDEFIMTKEAMEEQGLVFVKGSEKKFQLGGKNAISAKFRSKRENHTEQYVTFILVHNEPKRYATLFVSNDEFTDKKNTLKKICESWRFR